MAGMAGFEPLMLAGSLFFPAMGAKGEQSRSSVLQ